MPIAYKWHPITDLGDDPQPLTDGELDSLTRVWATQKGELAESGELNEFDKRLRREWAIETGIIEDVYSLERGITRTLIEKGIEAALIPHSATNPDPELVARIIQDHYDALEGMFDFVGGQRQLSIGYVKELHAALLRNQTAYTVVDQFGRAFEKPLEKGRYKDAPNNPSREDGSVHEYCPPEHVAPRWTGCYKCTRSTGGTVYQWKLNPHGYIIASRRSIRSRMVMAVWPVRSQACCSSRLVGFPWW